MKKLRDKVFFTLFILLTGFVIINLIYTSYTDYSYYEDQVESNLIRFVSDQRRRQDNIDMNIPENDRKQVYMDISIYTIKYDNDNNVTEIIYHSQETSANEAIEDEANQLLSTKEHTGSFVGNLFFNQYAYSFADDNTLIIIDNKTINSNLQTKLRHSLFIFVGVEFIAILLTIFITVWIIKPVEEAFKRQKNFVADASHELKTPLAVIMASADALSNNPTETKWITNIQEESDRMNKLIKEMLDLAKMENGQVKKEFSDEDVSRIIEKSTLIYDSLAFEKNVMIDYDIEEDISFKCDQSQIKQLIGILMDNAIKHAFPHSTIDLSFKKTNNGIRLKVTNKGEPIAHEDEEKIFERFYKADSSRNRNDNHYGLGLAIAKNIVEGHGGKIRAYSKNDLTTFEVLFKY